MFHQNLGIIQRKNRIGKTDTFPVFKDQVQLQIEAWDFQFLAKPLEGPSSPGAPEGREAVSTATGAHGAVPSSSAW